MTPKTPAQEWEELKDEVCGLVHRCFRRGIQLGEVSQGGCTPNDLVRESKVLKECQERTEAFMEKVHEFMLAHFDASKKPAAQPKRTA